ncbi:TauD/TfdA family dioxygenase [Streptomyces vietnamensis]|uniref:Clavaminate synthase n=1 Tax=Streptomyces vietnamensis TaxID=362257 RepID=A0A0B5IH95_9ACTN|nr:TauD/TfdA family dioxygenase [Streptomyces vietnamensis]AJF69907.1 clavaminate synthase [Streptomyces vietnamensis]
MTIPLQLSEHSVDDHTRDVLAKEIGDRLADAEFDPDRETAILARIGAHVLRGRLPVDVLDAVTSFTGSGCHALLVDNLVVPKVPPTPVNGFCDEAPLAVVNAIQFGMIQLLGLTPFAVPYENEGRLIRNVVPNPAAAGQTSSWGSDAEFFWHTDNPHLPFGEEGYDPRPYVPRYLTFCTLRNLEEVPTELMSVESATHGLDRELGRLLASASYEISAPDSNDVSEGGDRLALRGAPVLEQSETGLRVRFDLGTTSSRRHEATTALASWADTLAEGPAWDPVLRAGQFLAFDNYRVLHRRKAFTARHDDNARWLRRCYAS